MRTDVIQLRQKASEARDYINYSIDIYNYIGMEAPQHLYDMLNTLNTVEPYLYRRTLGQIQFVPLLIRGIAAVSAIVGIIFTIHEKSVSDKAQAEVELQKLELIKQGVLPSDTIIGVKKDTLGDTLDKVRSILLISVVIVSIVSITKMFKH
jgi:hypothetical protein